MQNEAAERQRSKDNALAARLAELKRERDLYKGALTKKEGEVVELRQQKDKLLKEYNKARLFRDRVLAKVDSKTAKWLNKLAASDPPPAHRDSWE